MDWHQRTIRLPTLGRGCHLVTREIVSAVPELAEIRVGLAHMFLLHTSASLAINENADPTVRGDLSRHLDVLAPEGAAHYRHTYEGPDDMPAHIKAVLVGAGLVVPVTDGRLALGTWQGVYLCEHRHRPRARRVVVTVFGSPEAPRGRAKALR